MQIDLLAVNDLIRKNVSGVKVFMALSNLNLGNLFIKCLVGNLYFRTVHVATLTLLKTNSSTFCKIHSHSHLKLQTVKNICETPN
jgi:hypothetical protein